MIFKDPIIKDQFDRCCPMLKLVCMEFERLSMSFNKTPVMTRLIGKIDGDSGVHSAGRAADFRDEFDGGFVYTLEERIVIIETIESLFPRLDGLKTIMHHSFQSGPFHFHVQVAPSIVAYSNMIFPLYS